MDSYQIPYILLYCTSQPSYNLGSFGYIDLVTQKNFHFEPSQEIEKQNKTRDIHQESAKERGSQLQEEILKKDNQKRKENKFQSGKNREKDVEFKQRQQTVNRNLCSNTWKVYLKQLRDKNTETFKSLKKIIESNQIDTTVEKFMAKINCHFPPSTTYVSFESVKKLCSCNGEGQGDLNFSKVFRISISRFYAYEIFTVNVKSIRTTRKIRNQQIKQGKIFLKQLFA